MKRRAKASNCKHFKQCGNVFGGCTHPKSASACIYRYLDECVISERQYKLKTIE